MADEKFDDKQPQGNQPGSSEGPGATRSDPSSAKQPTESDAKRPANAGAGHQTDSGAERSTNSGAGHPGQGSRQDDGSSSGARAHGRDQDVAEEGGSFERETPSSTDGNPDDVGASSAKAPQADESRHPSHDHGSHDHGASETDAGAQGDQVYEGQPVEGEFDLDALDFEPELTDPMAELQRERDSYLESLQRLQADFDNYKKRVARQQSELGAAGTRSLVIKLLPALDTLTLALAHATSDAGSDEVASVLSQISASFVEVLAKEGLEVIEPMGKRFDPEEAEAVAHDDGDGEPTVTEVFRVGYRWQGQTLRPAMVKVTGS
jgi:molecular chaperone GrpE